MKFRMFKKWILACFASISTVLILTTAFAVDNNGLFQLEGNAVQDGVPGEDWATLYNNGANTGGSSIKFTDILHDEPDAMGNDPTVFTGGRKDIQDISSWGHKTGSSPDKDEITHAYAAAYAKGTDTIVYFGADRISNKGDAFMGFWFFKKHIESLGDGSFDGMHSEGDVLILTNFPQANNASPQIRVALWDTSCSKADNNDPQVGDCTAKNLKLLLKSNAICGSGGGDLACAITNDEDGLYDPTPSPWSFQSKNDNEADRFPYESFFEGGINLTQLVGGDSCFSSFMAETRSSKSFTATLKDYVLGDFELCSVAIVKECFKGSVNPAETGFDFPYNGTVENDGAGALYNVVVIDDYGTPGDTSDDITHTIGTLLKDNTANFSGTILNSQQNGPLNTATVYAAGFEGGELTITATHSDVCEPADLSPEISVTKTCSTAVMAMDGKVVVGVDFMGQVCNTSSGSGAISLVGVTVIDDGGTPGAGNTGDDQTFTIGELAPGVCASYSSSYLPSTVNSSDPAAAVFSDTVSAVGTGKLGSGTVTAMTTAHCHLCPADEHSH
ncbi:MAG: DUF11 domain-containing protein [Colwellia sp.]|nr:DUF11 domain-containing protein [Colwellia sp.]